METVPSDLSELLLYLARWILFIELVALAFRWVIATDHELKLWVRWLEHPEHSKGRNDAVAAMIALSLNLGIMLALSHNILLLSGYFSAYYMLNYWTQWLANAHFKDAMDHTRKYKENEIVGDKSWQKALTVLEQYWMERPQLGRITTMMFIGCIAFSLALGSKAGQNSYRHNLELAAYLVIAINILIGEILVGRWRHVRDQNIAAIVATAPLKSRAHALEV